MLNSLRLRILDMKWSPIICREYVFIGGTFRYVKRKIFRRDKWRKIVSEPPKLLGLNITDRCNANCCYCAYKFDNPEGIMDMRVYEKAVREFSEMGGGTIGLGPLTGEPLLDPYFTQRIEFASQFQNIKRIHFPSNGILFQKEEIIRDLIQLSSKIRIELSLSLPGFKKVMFERVYNVGNYEKVLYGVHNLLKTNKEENEPLDIHLELQPDRGGVLKDTDFKNLICPYISNKNIGLDRTRDNWCGQIRPEHLTGDMILLRPSKFRNIPCALLLVGICILVNGDARMCGCTYGKEGKHDELTIGNIKERSLSEIWFGSEPTKICEQFLRGELPLPCQKCFMYTPY